MKFPVSRSLFNYPPPTSSLRMWSMLLQKHSFQEYQSRCIARQSGTILELGKLGQRRASSRPAQSTHREPVSKEGCETITITHTHQTVAPIPSPPQLLAIITPFPVSVCSAIQGSRTHTLFFLWGPAVSLTLCLQGSSVSQRVLGCLIFQVCSAFIQPCGLALVSVCSP